MIPNFRRIRRPQHLPEPAANADAHAKAGGITWLVAGGALLVFYRLTGRGTDLCLEE